MSAWVLSLTKDRSAFCQCKHCSTFHEHLLALCTHWAPVTAAKLTLCDMAGSPSPSVSSVKPNTSPKLAQCCQYTSHPITHTRAVKESEQSQSWCETRLPTSPGAKHRYSRLLLWGVSGITHHQLLAHFNYCAHFILQIIVGWTIVEWIIVGWTICGPYWPQIYLNIFTITIWTWGMPTDSPATAISAEFAVQLYSTLLVIYFCFAMTELVLISLGLTSLFFALMIRGPKVTQNRKHKGWDTILVLV